MTSENEQPEWLNYVKIHGMKAKSIISEHNLDMTQWMNMDRESVI